MEISLTQGKIAVIDDVDWPLVAPFKWYAQREPNGRWYARATVWNPETKTVSKISMHRVILGVSGFENKVDHRDGDGLKNTRENLRACTNAQNIRNRPKDSVPTASRFKGVTWSRRNQRWFARICFDGKQIHLGSFRIEEDAARAYNEAATRLFGDFARLNELVSAG
jgi:hypothetical protein